VTIPHPLQFLGKPYLESLQTKLESNKVFAFILKCLDPAKQQRQQSTFQVIQYNTDLGW